MAVVEQTHSSSFSIFHNRNFSLLWSGQLVSTIGDSLMSLAASIMIYRLTGSALSVGLMLMATAAPSILLGLVAGVLVDRFNRKRIMIAADLTRAVLVLLIPFLVPLNIAWLYVIVLLTSCVSQFFEPAHAAVVPEVATDEELAAANSLLAISSFGSTAVGFAASGLIASQFSIEWAFYLDALSFLFSAVCLAFLRLQPMEPDIVSSVSNLFSNLRGGLDFLWNKPILRSAFFITPMVGLSFGMWNTLLLPFARQALHASEFEYGLQEGLTSVGFVVGSLLMAGLSERLHEGQWLSLSFLAMGALGAVYSTLASVPIALIFVMLSGFSNAPSAVGRQLLVQRNTARNVRGRVNSVFFVSRDSAFLVGMAAAGLADIIGVREMIRVSALLVLVPGVFALLLPGLREPIAEWRRDLRLLRSDAPGLPLQPGRIATIADLEGLVALLPGFSGLSLEDRQNLASQSLVADVPSGAMIVKHGESGGRAFYIVDGRVVAGMPGKGGNPRILETMHRGDLFGDVSVPPHPHHRAADIVATESTTLLHLPGAVLRKLGGHSSVRDLVHLKFFHHPHRVHLGELPRMARSDQHLLRELRRSPEKRKEKGE